MTDKPNEADTFVVIECPICHTKSPLTYTPPADQWTPGVYQFTCKTCWERSKEKSDD